MELNELGATKTKDVYIFFTQVNRLSSIFFVDRKYFFNTIHPNNHTWKIHVLAHEKDTLSEWQENL